MELDSTERVSAAAALGATGAALALAAAAQVVVERRNLAFPSWGETAVELAFMSGVFLVTVVGFRLCSGHAPSAAELGLGSPRGRVRRAGRGRSMLLGVAPLALMIPVVVRLDTGVALTLVTLLVRWPVSVLAQQMLFFGWLQPRLGANGLRNAALLYAAFHLATPGVLLGVVPLGFLFAWLRARTGDIRAGAYAHYLTNMLFVLAFGS